MLIESSQERCTSRTTSTCIVKTIAQNVPYERVEGYYYINRNTILEKKEEILSIIERFISYF